MVPGAPSGIYLFVHVVPDEVFEVDKLSIWDEYRCLEYSWFVILCTIPDVKQLYSSSFTSQTLESQFNPRETLKLHPDPQTLFHARLPLNGRGDFSGGLHITKLPKEAHAVLLTASDGNFRAGSPTACTEGLSQCHARQDKMRIPIFLVCGHHSSKHAHQAR